jgi:hypothetical protein
MVPHRDKWVDARQEEDRNRMGRMGRMVFAGVLDRDEWMHVDEEDMSRMG